MTSTFRPCQIVCLEYDDSRLYAEVVQAVEERQICWVRPFVLAVSPQTNPAKNVDQQTRSSAYEMPLSEYYDLRHGADLLWPLTFFRAALDIEVLPLLHYLYPNHESSKLDLVGHSQFKIFVQRLWQAYPEAF